MFQTTKDDVIFSGHGLTMPEAGRVTRVPSGVSFVMLGPPGASITDDLGQLLEGRIFISKIFIASSVSNTKSPVKPIIFTSASGSIPNLILSAPRQLDVGGKGVVPHIIGVEAKTHLHDLWPRLKPFLKQGKTIRVIWAACLALNGDAPLVDGEAG